jgi:hypothetical protein
MASSVRGSGIFLDSVCALANGDASDPAAIISQTEKLDAHINQHTKYAIVDTQVYRFLALSSAYNPPLCVALLFDYRICSLQNLMLPAYSRMTGWGREEPNQYGIKQFNSMALHGPGCVKTI